MNELKVALGSTTDMTVFRRLGELGYRSSYSHRGMFYTLDEIAQFDSKGLWSCRGVHFSRMGSLIDTVEQFVVAARQGCLAGELAGDLHLPVKEPLLKLVQTKRVLREDLDGRHLYCSPDPTMRRAQLAGRREIPSNVTLGAAETLPTDETKAAILLFLSTLDEKQRRLYAGLESLRVGRGGDRRIAAWTGMDVHTIARGRQELLARDLELDRVRRTGGGRRSVEKKRPRSSPGSGS
jgi:hypothetical protein